MDKAKLLLSVLKALPLIDRILFSLANLVGSKEKFKISVYGPNAVEKILLWGAYQARSGQQIHFEIICTTRACSVLQKAMVSEVMNMKSKLIVRSEAS